MNRRQLWRLLLPAVALACGEDGTTGPGADRDPLSILGRGIVAARYTGEVWVHGDVAYTSTWGNRLVNGVGRQGNALYIWSVSGETPQLVDSVILDGVGQLGDVEVSPDGRYLVMPSEYTNGALFTFDLSNPRRPGLLSTFRSPAITRGIHTAEIEVVNGRLYAFLAVNTGIDHPPRLVVVDLQDPAQPREVLRLDITGSFLHDVFVRDGVLFTAEWNNGLVIRDIGGAGRGGTVEAPVRLGSVLTVGGAVHNVWWFHDPSNGSKRYAFVGQEGPATLFTASSGDLHVVDVSDMTAPHEVAFLTVPGAGAHNFSMDEPQGILYAAFYNGGVQALDVRGDLSACSTAERSPDGRCDLEKMGRVKAVGLANAGVPVFVWGVHVAGGAVYASDMPNGLWKLTPVNR
jgi:hypothetical protein